MAHFIDERCDGCSACAHQCPTEAISGRRGELYTVAPELCIDCNVCGWICHVEAVLDERGERIARRRRPERPRPLIDVDRCNGCGLCVDFCPFDCLTLIGPRFQGVVMLDAPGACVACSDCAAVCIKDAIVM